MKKNINIIKNVFSFDCSFTGKKNEKHAKVDKLISGQMKMPTTTLGGRSIVEDFSLLTSQIYCKPDCK